ncbi:MAG: hypothetical protein IKL65_01620 [Bacilli bacterium]|nr:hypothetical protein [Bacilli bacterium]
MINLYNQLAIYKFDLIKLFITNKKLTDSQYKEIKKTLLTINYLMKALKSNKELNYDEEISKIENCVSKTK